MYTFDSRVRYSETDENGKLTVTGVMNYLQDCSTFQSEDLGLGIEYLKRSSRAWWLSSWQIVIERYPVLGEEIVIGTWPYDFKGMYGYRNFMIRDKAGVDLVKADSVWFFFDTEEGRPIKVRESDVRGYGTGSEKRLEMEYAPRKIALPDTGEEAKAVLVGSHHIDTNHHVNNAQYVEMARSAVPEDFLIREVRAEYKKAAVCNDLIHPFVGRAGEGYTVALNSAQGTPYAVVWLGGRQERKTL